MFYYLANPYQGSKELMKERFEKCAKAVSKLIKNGIPTFSPIVHNHAMIETTGDWTLDERKKLLLPFDFSILLKANGMILLKLEGYLESYGVEKELKFCLENKIVVHEFTYDEIMNETQKLNALKSSKDLGIFL